MSFVFKYYTIPFSQLTRLNPAFPKAFPKAGHAKNKAIGFSPESLISLVLLIERNHAVLVFNLNDFSLVVRTARFADSVRHHQGAALAALN